MEEEIISASKRRVALDLKITKLNHSLNDFKNKYPSSYMLKDEYDNIIRELKELLMEQKEIDMGRFFINRSKIKDVNIEMPQKKDKAESDGLTILKKLSLTEQNFLKEHNYDCERDEYKIFSTEKSPDNDFVKKWEFVRFVSFKQPLSSYYKDRDWNN